jgi:hypothetical protein
MKGKTCLVLLVFCLFTITKAQTLIEQKHKLVQSVIDSLMRGSAFPDSLYQHYDFNSFFTLDAVNEPIDTLNIDYGLLNAAIFYALNEIRWKKGRNELTFDPQIRNAAFCHSIQMVQSNFLSHINKKDSTLRDVWNRLMFFGLPADQASAYYGEIINFFDVVEWGKMPNRYTNVKEDGVYVPYYVNRKGKLLKKVVMPTYEMLARIAVSLWMKSKPHKRILLDRSFQFSGTGAMIYCKFNSKKMYVPRVKITADFWTDDPK